MDDTRTCDFSALAFVCEFYIFTECLALRKRSVRKPDARHIDLASSLCQLQIWREF
jgi:hypothetical protein